ncbi:MAG: ATP-binding cassette domain-containing protein [Actinobacteria bacterium]|nr:ATP-binding cassette domain-containing protein [Actinomycetota bacterium]
MDGLKPIVLDLITRDAIQESYIITQNLGLKTLRGQAFGGIDMMIPEGKVIALCGEHGTGKTSLLLTLSGRMAFNEGVLKVSGFTLPKERNRMRKIAGLGFFARINEVQSSLSMLAITSAELELYGRRGGSKQASEYLRVWALGELSAKRAEELSAEENVRFGIALGMVCRPKILMIDDIETNLTQHQGRKLMHFLKLLTVQGDLTILVACTEYEIARGADAVVLLSPGARMQRDTVEKRVVLHEQSSHMGSPTGTKAPAIVGGKQGFYEDAHDDLDESAGDRASAEVAHIKQGGA